MSMGGDKARRRRRIASGRKGEMRVRGEGLGRRGWEAHGGEECELLLLLLVVVACSSLTVRVSASDLVGLESRALLRHVYLGMGARRPNDF